MHSDPAPPDADPLVLMVPSLASATALRLAERAVQRAAAEGWRIAVAVVDPQGALLAAVRMDGATPPIMEFAQDKAYTAATMRRSTQAFAERMDSSPSLRLGLSTRSRFLVWGGGLPIVHDGVVVGGIGVSGAKDHEDVACARAALADEGLGWEV